MDILIEQQNGTSVLKLSGEVDLNTSPELRSQIKGVLQENNKSVCVDLSAVKYIDSSGIATLIEAQQKLFDTSGELSLCGIPQKIYSVFEIAKLDQVFRIYPDLDAALKG